MLSRFGSLAVGNEDVGRAVLCLEALEKPSSLRLLPILGTPWLVDPHPNLCLRQHTAVFSLCVCLFSSYKDNSS